MNRSTVISLEFHPKLNAISKDKGLRDGLSAVTQIGETFWVANDEATTLERLSLVRSPESGVTTYGRHMQFSLMDYLRILQKAEDFKDQNEVDVEGLDYAGGYLWLVGSHSLTHKRPKLKNGPRKAQEQLGEVSRGGNRYLLARIPVVEDDGTYALTKNTKKNGKERTAAQLHGDEQGNDLTEALSEDDHLGSFLAIPGKDNGFDIEGLAVVGERLFFGLRGPVLRGWAVILEVELKEDNKQPSILELKSIGKKGRLYRKHFLRWVNGSKLGCSKCWGCW